MAMIGVVMSANIRSAARKWPIYPLGPPVQRHQSILIYQLHILPTAFYYYSPYSIRGSNLPDYTLKHLNDAYCQASFGIASSTGGSELQWELG
jgi:hypothetical protein